MAEKKVIPNDKQVVSVTPNIEALLMKAVENNVPIETMEKLMAMRDKLKAEWAKEAYYTDMANLQAELPVIQKTHPAGDDDFNYKYAPLDAILKAKNGNEKTVKELIRDYGFSYSHDAAYESDPPAQVVTCIITHKEGHSEKNIFRSPIDSGGRMNVIQKNASALTYGKRYTFQNGFGIVVGGEDDDAQSVGFEKEPETVPEVPKSAPKRTAEDKKAETQAILGEIKEILEDDVFIDLDRTKARQQAKKAQNNGELRSLKYQLTTEKMNRYNQIADEKLGDKDMETPTLLNESAFDAE